jgi:hypothetical protein
MKTVSRYYAYAVITRPSIQPRGPNLDFRSHALSRRKCHPAWMAGSIMRQFPDSDETGGHPGRTSPFIATAAPGASELLSQGRARFETLASQAPHASRRLLRKLLMLRDACFASSSCFETLASQAPQHEGAPPPAAADP